MPPMPPPLPPMPPVDYLTSCNEDKECEAGWICSYSLSLLTPTGGTCIPAPPAPPATCQTNMECPVGQTCWKTLPGIPRGAPGMCGKTQPCNTHANCKEGQHCKRNGFCGESPAPKPPRSCPRFQPKPLSKCPPLLQGATCHYTEYTDRGGDLAIRMVCQIGKWQKIGW